jgi:hypothetical protein
MQVSVKNAGAAVRDSGLALGDTVNERETTAGKMKIAILLIVVVLAAFTFAGLEFRELTRAESALAEASYSDAESLANLVVLPGLARRAQAIRSAAEAEQEKDTSAWSNFTDASQRFVAYDRDPNTADTFNRNLLQKLQNAMLELASCQTVLQMTASGLRSKLVAPDPKLFISSVDDLKSLNHSARLIRLGIRTTDQSMRFLDWAITVVSPGVYSTPSATRAYALDFGDQRWKSVAPRNPVQLLDWRRGFALAFVSSGLDFGGNSGDTSWNVWRISSDGNVETSDASDLRPFGDGVQSFEGDLAAGSRDLWRSAPFDECHACPHLHQEFSAKWDSIQGRYVLTSSHFDDGPYFQLVRFINDYMYTDFAPEAAPMSATFDALRLAASNGLCEASRENVNGNSGSVLLSCQGTDVTVEARKIAGSWKLSSVSPEMSYSP